MQVPETQAAEFEIGKFTCPVTHRQIPVKANNSWTLIDWPVEIGTCPACGGDHLVRLEDLQHPPVFGYE